MKINLKDKYLFTFKHFLYSNISNRFTYRENELNKNLQFYFLTIITINNNQNNDNQQK